MIKMGKINNKIVIKIEIEILIVWIKNIIKWK